MRERKPKIKKIILICIGILVLTVIAVFTVFSEKNIWICKNNEWKKLYPWASIKTMHVGGCYSEDVTGKSIID